MLARLDEARRRERLDMPGFQLHTLRGDLAGSWSITVRAIWRIIFRVERGDATHANLADSH
jgi:proteic killer suppression protein